MIMQDNEKKPALRFKGFTDPWEQRKLGDLCVEFRSGEFISASDITETGEYPVFGGNGLRGFTDRFNHDGEYTLIGRQGALCGNVNFAVGKSYFTEHAIAVRADKKNQTRFLYYLFSTMDLGQYSGQSAQPGLAVGNLVELKSTLPDKQEQEKISGVLTALDTLITLHQRKYEKLVNIKKSMLDKMFPKNGASVPEIRFKGFTDPWEQRKLKELYFQLTERNADLLPYQKTLSVATMSFKTDGNGAADTSLANYKRLRTGDIAFEGHTSKEFRYGRFVLNDVGDGIMSPRFSALRPLHEMPINFWKYYIHYEPIMRKVLVNSTKAGTMMNELVINEFLQESILVPSVAEQQAIGRFFKQLDTLITLHQRKLEKLQNIKKSCLEKMFV